MKHEQNKKTKQPKGLQSHQVWLNSTENKVWQDTDLAHVFLQVRLAQSGRNMNQISMWPGVVPSINK